MSNLKPIQSVPVTIFAIICLNVHFKVIVIFLTVDYLFGVNGEICDLRSYES